MSKDIKALIESGKTVTEILEEASKVSAKDFEIGDRIKYTFGGKVFKGKIADHFGDGVLVNLSKSLYYPSNSKAANPMGYNTDSSVKSFELFDGETNPYGTIQMLKKL